MPASFFDNLLASTNPTVDAYFAADYTLRWQGRQIAITAILSAQDYDVDTEADLIETSHTHNFEVTAADIIFDGLVMLPQPGMQFVEDLGDGTSAVYEVMKTKSGRCYNTIGDGIRMLVYTRQIRKREINP